jgi:hypothetical protein
MTEAEWLVCANPREMLRLLRDKVSERRWRLFGCGLCREVIDKFTDKRSRRAIEVAERYADDEATQEELYNVYRNSVLNRLNPDIERAATIVASDRPHLTAAWLDECTTLSWEKQAVLLRDIVGNPFSPLTASPEWLTTTTVSIARQMYETRDFSAMPIVADALQDAGCDNDDILNHCRGPGPHVRGCWVVDLILGKE